MLTSRILRLGRTRALPKILLVWLGKRLKWFAVLDNFKRIRTFIWRVDVDVWDEGPAHNDRNRRF